MHKVDKCGQRFETEEEFAKHWKEEKHESITCIYEHCDINSEKTVQLKKHEEFPFRPPQISQTHQSKHGADGKNTLELVFVVDV